MFTYAVKVDIGVSAKNNDDRALIGKELVVEGEISGSCCKSYISSAVFDGVSGMTMGYKAAETAAEYLKILDKESVSAFDIRKCIEEANIKIRTMQTVENIPKGMRTTIAGFYADEKHIIIYNAGDSRVYRFRYRFFTQLSKEHSLVQQMIDAEQIIIEEAKKTF